MTASTKELIERLLRKNEDGTLAEITEADQQAAADALERLTLKLAEVESKTLQPVVVEPLKLFDSQWMNIVNNERCYENYDKEEAVHLAVKLTEAKMAELHSEKVARLQAERDMLRKQAAWEAEKREGHYEDRARLEREIIALQEQVKMLREVLGGMIEVFGNKEHVLTLHEVIDAKKALAATEPKEKAE